MTYRISTVVEKDANGYVAYCPELPGCWTQGDSYEEVLVNIREAAELYLETLSVEERVELSSSTITMTSLDVVIA